MFRKLQMNIRALVVVAVFLASFASYGSALASTGNTNYQGANLMMSSVKSHLQYPIPAGMKRDAEGYISFQNIQANPGATYQDEASFVAAWNVCQIMVSNDQTPIFGATVTADAIAKILNSDRHEMLSMTGLTECQKNLLYRTGCPAASKSAVAGAGEDCYTRQLTACHFLKNPVAQDGLAITHVGDPEADNALKDCETWGLSPAMYDKIMASKDMDTGHVVAQAASMSPAEVEKVQAAANEKRAAFDQSLTARDTALFAAMSVTIQEQINWKLNRQNEQFAEQTRILAEQTKLLTQQNKLLTQILAKEQPVLADR